MTTNLSPERIAAIKTSLELGLRLQQDMPEIALDYRDMTASEIVHKRNIIKRYGSGKSVITDEIALAGVYYALRGHLGEMGVPPYKPLIEEQERIRISGEHRPITSSDEEIRRKFHASGGKATLELKVGVHGRTAEQRREDRKKLLKAKGEISWEDEIEIAYDLSQNPRYHFQNGPYRGRINNELIAQTLNQIYHDGKPVRTSQTLKSELYRFRKKRRLSQAS